MACRAVCGCSLCTEMKDYRGSEIPSVSSYLKIGRGAAEAVAGWI